MTDLKELIEQELDQYLEWPTADKSHVTTVSAKLFAEHMARLYADHIADARKKVGRPQIREVFLRNGFTIAPDRDDLEDRVYESVFELLDSAIQYVGSAVQGEPVAEVSQETFSGDGTSDIITKNLPIGMKLYAAPQPAPDVAGLVEALEEACEHHLPIGSRALELATIALAAHHKGGGQ